MHRTLTLKFSFVIISLCLVVVEMRTKCEGLYYNVNISVQHWISTMLNLTFATENVLDA